MRLSNGFVIDKEKTFGELKFTAVRDVFLQNEDGTPSTQLKKRIYDFQQLKKPGTEILRTRDQTLVVLLGVFFLRHYKTTLLLC